MTYNIPVWMHIINTNVFNVRGESFIEPKVTPPIHGHNIAKPLNFEEKKKGRKIEIEKKYFFVFISFNYIFHGIFA